MRQSSGKVHIVLLYGFARNGLLRMIAVGHYCQSRKTLHFFSKMDNKCPLRCWENAFSCVFSFVVTSWVYNAFAIPLLFLLVLECSWLCVPDFSTLSSASSTSSESTSVTATTGIDSVRVVFLNRLPFALVSYVRLGFCRSYPASHCERTFRKFLECTVLAVSNLHNGMMLCRWCQ